MKDEIFQIVYCSRNHVTGTAAEVNAQIEGILRASRRNNVRVGVTGALFYNAVFFAQVLEGGLDEVQGVFERLQLDPRHSDLVVLESGFVPERDFPDWSMAYAGASPESQPSFINSLMQDAGLDEASLNGKKIKVFLRDVLVKQENWALPERPPAMCPARTAAHI